MLPKNSPYEIPTLLCSTCGSEMKMRVKKAGKGMIEEIIYTCVLCKYEHSRVMNYSNGRERPIPPEPAKQELQPH
jgi:hypothetical protein